MPFGKYAGRLLIDLPEPYLLWFEKKGFPNGKLGGLMQLSLDIKRNGLTGLLQPLKNTQDGTARAMVMTPEEFLTMLDNTPEAVSFDQLIKTIDSHYRYTPGQFSNGLGDERIVNESGVNEGSCKLFAFARLHKLNKAQTLACFGRYYREDVLGHPHDDNHRNIRTFMKYGWDGIEFDSIILNEYV